MLQNSWTNYAIIVILKNGQSNAIYEFAYFVNNIQRLTKPKIDLYNSINTTEKMKQQLGIKAIDEYTKVRVSSPVTWCVQMINVIKMLCGSHKIFRIISKDEAFDQNCNSPTAIRCRISMNRIPCYPRKRTKQYTPLWNVLNTINREIRGAIFAFIFVHSIIHSSTGIFEIA